MGAGAGTVTSANDYNFETRILAHPLTLDVSVTRPQNDPHIYISMERVGEPIQREGEPLTMHWGVVLHDDDDRSVYIRPPDSMWPKGTDPRPGEPSLQTSFSSAGVLEWSFEEQNAPSGIVFLVFIREGHGWRNQWFKQTDGSSFFIHLTPALSKSEVLRRAKAREEEKAREIQRQKDEEERRQKEIAEREVIKQKEASLKAKRESEAENYITDAISIPGLKLFKSFDEEYEFGRLLIRVLIPKNGDENQDSDDIPGRQSSSQVFIASTLALEGSDIILHWGVKKGRNSGWIAAQPDAWPKNTNRMDDGKAVQTRLEPYGSQCGVRVTSIKNLDADAIGIFAVVHAPTAPDHLKWIKAARGGDLFIPTTPPPPLPGFSKDSDVSDLCKSILDGVIEREMEYGSWTLMHRYGHARHLVDSVIGTDEDCWGALYVWMRYSQIRVLDWQRRYNTQPRQLSWSQLSLVTLLANKFKYVPEVRWLCRLAMSCVGRGGSGDLGQRIRDDILVILRHHRGWKHGSMMEQWHQKLHNNTSPDDVIICDALLAFWHGNGDLSAYWHVINSNGLTRERMASYEQPITTDPDFPGHIKDTMIHELNRYGELLKQVHLGTDLNSIVGRCQGFMDGGTREQVNGFMFARSSGASIVDILRSVAHARDSVCKQVTFSDYLNDEQRRDMIFLDLAIESEARRLLEGTHGLGHDGTLWSHLTGIRAAAAALKCSEAGLVTEGELQRAIHDLIAVIERVGQQGESHDVGLRAAAGMNIIRNVLTAIIDRYANKLGPIAKCLGLAFGADKAIISTFVEEAVRGGPGFSLSYLLRKADPAVRRVARLGPFSVVSPISKETKGPVVVFNKLRESVVATFKRGTVVIANSCDGDEEVPENTAYVVIGSTVDVLSHVSVRARNEHYGLVSCLDSEKMAELRGLHGCIVKAKLSGEDFQVDVVDESGRMSPSVGVQAVMKRVKSLGLITPPSGLMTPPDAMATSKPAGLGALFGRQLSEKSLSILSNKRKAINRRQLGAPWAIRPSEFNSELVGSKSLNLQRLVALGLPDWIKTPVSVAIPNGAMRKAMNFETNSDLLEEYKRLSKEISKAKVGDVKLCPKLRDIVMELESPEGLNEAMRGVLDDLGCEEIDKALPGAWTAIKKVWASVWNERAHLARQKLKLSVEDVDMAVLCQKVVEADYAFVIHTTNPLTNDSNEIYAEAVIGLGETLVGNAPGQALGFTMRKDEDLDTVTAIVRSYPSKATALFGGEYIFRSDSNAEDLDGFAGAGLHDSVPISENIVEDIDYSKERIMVDDEFRDFLMRGIAKIGVVVEDIMGGVPQDIEGCFKDGEFYVVQSRPQV
eukprot:GFKZ01011322.1.p1 GENE.GFKZ01011322.1~~GFKZ01011322.1.p1  ORF type:complete len:1339 (+),score=210.60 GFKZ01011322.1:272-4288(+)